MPPNEPKLTAKRLTLGGVAAALIGLLYEYREPIVAWLEGLL